MMRRGRGERFKGFDLEIGAGDGKEGGIEKGGGEENINPISSVRRQPTSKLKAEDKAGVCLRREGERYHGKDPRQLCTVHKRTRLEATLGIQIDHFQVIWQDYSGLHSIHYPSLR
jgi:hypothetical protein